MPTMSTRAPNYRRLILVRHAQATIEGDHYDQLSALGERQARRLGEHWSDQGFQPDAVYLGPLARHRETFEQVASVYGTRNLPWPRSQLLSSLNEHAGMEVVDESLAGVAQKDPQVAEWVREMEDEPEHRVRHYFKIFRHLTRLWARGELSDSSQESWQAFRERVAEGLHHMAEGEAQTTVAFTSAGAVAAAVAVGLELEDEKTLELSWAVQNTGLTEFLIRPQHVHLRSFNALPHLLDETMITWV